MTRTRLSGSSSRRATSPRMRNGAWQDTHMVSSSAMRSKVARTERGSIATAEMRFCATRSGTTCAAAAKAR